MANPASPPHLIDHRALGQFRQRARHMVPAIDFLMQEIAAGLADRLALVNRNFAAGYDLGGGIAPYLTNIDVTSAMLDVTAAEPFERLPLAPACADLILSGLVLDRVNDLPGVLTQINRALRPDGLMLASLLGGETLYELREVLLLAEQQITGRVHPRTLPMADIRDLGGLLQRAGFALPVADSERLRVTYGSLFDLMHELRAMGLQNCHTGRARSFLRRDVIGRAAALYPERHPAPAAEPEGRIVATFEIITLTGWHPHKSQQQPLKPGSAKASLAAALKPKSPTENP